MLAILKTKKLQMEALKAQLRFREHVLKQDIGNKTVSRFSKDGHPLTVCDLAAHLKSLLVHALALPVDNNAPCFLVGQRVKHWCQEEEDGGNTVQRWHCGRVISQVEVLGRALSLSLSLSCSPPLSLSSSHRTVIGSCLFLKLHIGLVGELYLSTNC